MKSASMVVVVVALMTFVGCKGKSSDTNAAPSGSAKVQGTVTNAPPPPPAYVPPPPVDTVALKKKVRMEPSGAYEDDSCTARSMPPHAYRFGGGSFEEMSALASALGCTARYPSDVNRNFCCP